MKNQIIAAAAAAALFIACTRESIPATNGSAAGEKGEIVELSLNLLCGNGNQATKSALFEDDGVTDLNLYVWRNGILLEHRYYDNLEKEIRLSLVCGSGYSFYALANCGRRLEPETAGWKNDEGAMKQLSINYPGESGVKALCPMAGSAVGIEIGQSVQERLSLELERLVSRVRLNFRKDMALSSSGLEITGIRLHDAPASTLPFGGTGKAAEGNLCDGDFASDADLSFINSGGTIDFYVFENCWGDLLPGNTDPKQKVPSSLGNMRGPTYIEISASFGTNSLITGQLVYRIFPGRDATCNFDLRHNSSCTISIFGSKNGLGELNWQIEPDITFNDFLADYETTAGHPGNDLYLGEIFKGRICRIDNSIIDYFGGSLEAAADEITIRCIEDGTSTGDPVILTVNGTDEDGGISIEGTCRRASVSGCAFWICDSEGSPVTKIAGDVLVRKPAVVFSDESRADRPHATESEKTITINGGPVGLNVYFCDKAGNNLLSEAGGCYDFDGSVFDLRIYDNHDDWDGIYEFGCMESGITDRYDKDSHGLDGRPMCRTSITLTNDGREYDVNKDLWELVRSTRPICQTFHDSRHGLETQNVYDVDYFPLTIHYCDAAFGGSELAKELGVTTNQFFYVENPSNMSFLLTHLALAKQGDSTTGSNNYTWPSNMKYYVYTCPSGLNLPESLYLQYAEACYEQRDHYSYDGCYDIDGMDGSCVISLKNNFEDLLKALNYADGKYFYNTFGYYNPKGNHGYKLADGLNLMLDVRSTEGDRINYSYSIELENGSMECSYVYDNYPIKYVSTFSNGARGNYLDSHSTAYNIKNLYSGYPDLTPLNISGLMLKSRDMKFAIASPESTSPYYSVQYSGPVEDTGFPFELICNGACSYHDKGTRRDPVTAYPSTNYQKTSTAKSRHIYTENFTGSGIMNCFTSMFNTIYKDKYTWLGTDEGWDHHSHPTRLTLYPKISQSVNADCRYLYNLTFTSQNVRYANSGYSPDADSSPYSVKTEFNCKEFHKSFTHTMIVLK